MNIPIRGMRYVEFALRIILAFDLESYKSGVSGNEYIAR